jgi:hypothetical protein
MKLGNLLLIVAAALVADTVVASHDTTRVLTLRIASLSDSLRVVQRRAVQINQQADALDRALGLERAARDSLTATIVGYRGLVRTDTVRDTVVVDPGGRDGTAADTVHRGTFDIRQAPYTVHAQVMLPAPPSEGTMALAIDLDTMRFEVRLGCGPPNAAGARTAATTVTGPSWAAIQLGRIEQSPDVCAQLSVPASRWAPLRRALDRVGVSIGYVAGVGANSQFFGGPG